MRVTGQLLPTARAVAGWGTGWAVLWLVGWVTICGGIAIVDPDSVGPGDWRGLVTVMAPMGLFSGIAIAILIALARRGAAAGEPTLRRAALRGMLGTAIVQLFYLGHGDAGLAANLAMALMFSVFGSGVTVAWLWLGRAWSRRRSPRAVRG